MRNIDIDITVDIYDKGTDYNNYCNDCDASRIILVKLPQTACFKSFRVRKWFCNSGISHAVLGLHYLVNLAEHLGHDFFAESPRLFSPPTSNI